jgi:hypothetical protein
MLAGAALVGATAVGFAWLFIGGSSSTDLAQSLGQAPGIPPPDYAYLDNARVALYLGQLQGGLARSEQLSEQLSQGRNAGLSAGGVAVGGSAGSSASRERVVTPTATARFYQLLDLLDRDGYLHRIDVSAASNMLVREFAQVPEGTFVQLRRCRLRIPSYIQLAQLNFGSSRYYSPSMAYQGLGEGQPLTTEALGRALVRAGRLKDFLGGGVTVRVGEAQIARAMGHLAAVVKRNPRVPFSTCDGSAAAKPRGVDLLFPVRLGTLSSEPTLLSGPVTIVGKLVRSVRTHEEYVDQPSLAEFEVATHAVDNAASDESASDEEEDDKLSGELASDATVLAPGAVILPIAIYK